MSPQDADENLVLALGAPETKTPHTTGMNAAFVDGHVELLSSDTPTAQRLALISIADDDNNVLEDAE
jgi:prepilin-type processing-associated H-X9-DG protein